MEGESMFEMASFITTKNESSKGIRFRANMLLGNNLVTKE